MRHALVGVSVLFLFLIAGWAQNKDAETADAPSSAARVQALLESGKAPQAEAAARQWIKREPQSAQAWNLLGVSQVQQKRFEEAQSAFTRSAELDPKALIPRQNLVRLYLSQGSQQKAISTLTEAQSLGPLDDDLGMYFARTLVASGKKPQAIDVLQPIAERGESVQSMLMLASLQFEKGQARKAAAVLEKALEKAPNSEEVLYRFGQSEIAGGDPAKAIFALRAATRMNSHVGDYCYLLGVAWMQIGEMDSAIPELKKAGALEQDNALPRIGLGLAYNGLRDYAAAQKVLQDALTIDPENTEAMAAMAEALDGSGNSEKADELARIVTQRDAKNLTALLVLGNVRMNQGKLQESLAALKKAESINPTSKVHYLLSRVYSRLHQPEEAKRQLELYQQAQKEFEQNLMKLRGIKKSGGMKR